MIDTKKVIFTTLILIGLCTSCSGDEDDFERGNWIERSVFDGIPRSNVASFVIDNKGYLGTGYDGDDYLNDFWEYNIEGDYWSQKANFPGVARSSAIGFSINDKGYLGTGYDGDTELSDFWEYNQALNTWEQKADFLGGNRRSAVGFSSNTSGYVGTGFDGDNDKKDFWKYNPIANSWSELEGFGGNKRRDATAFKINEKVYFGTGVSNGIYKEDFWEFDTTTDTWTRKKDLDDDDDYNILRANATSFAINGLGYISTGYAAGAMSSTWEYNPTSDLWEEITAIEATPRQDAVSFSNGTRAFVTLGRSGSLYLDDTFELFPLQEYDDED